MLRQLERIVDDDWISRCWEYFSGFSYTSIPRINTRNSSGSRLERHGETDKYAGYFCSVQIQPFSAVTAEKVCTKSLGHIYAWCKYIFFCQHIAYFSNFHTVCTHFKNSFNDRCCFGVRNQFFLVFRITRMPIRCCAVNLLTAFALCFLYRTDLPAGIPCIKIVEIVFYP